MRGGSGGCAEDAITRARGAETVGVRGRTSRVHVARTAHGARGTAGGRTRRHVRRDETGLTYPPPLVRCSAVQEARTDAG